MPRLTFISCFLLKKSKECHKHPMEKSGKCMNAVITYLLRSSFMIVMRTYYARNYRAQYSCTAIVITTTLCNLFLTPTVHYIILQILYLCKYAIKSKQTRILKSESFTATKNKEKDFGMRDTILA